MIVITATAILHKDSQVICADVSNGADDMVRATVHQLVNHVIEELDYKAQRSSSGIRVLTITAEDLGKEGL